MKESLDTFQTYLWKQPNIVSAKTVNQYVSTFSKILKFSGGKPEHITRESLLKYTSSQPSRVAIRQLRTVMAYAKNLFPEVENLTDEEWKNIHTWKKKTMTQRTELSSKAIITRIHTIDHEVAQVMMLTALHTGCRMGALSNLKTSDYDYDTKQMLLTEKGGKSVIYQLEEFTLIERFERILEHNDPEHPLLAMRTIQKYCESIGLQSHDFRRLYSKKVQDQFVKDGYSKQEALELTSTAMNHENVDTTYGYANYESINLTKRGKNEK